jgi:AraC-like DNA-binding protein
MKEIDWWWDRGQALHFEGRWTLSRPAGISRKMPRNTGLLDPMDSQPLLGNPRLPFRSQGPADDLREWIEVFWSLRGQGRHTFDILPDSNFDLVFLLGRSSCSALLAGPYTRKVTISLDDSLELLCVRFQPGRMPRFGDVKPVELVNGGIALRKIPGMDLDALGERLTALSGFESRKVFLEQLLRENQPAAAFPEEGVRRCIRFMEACSGRLSVNHLSFHTGMGIRTLERMFLNEVGIPPIKVIRFLRYRSALAGLRQGTCRTLTELAHSCGYADQSHFIKDFGFFSGTLPSRI